MIRVNQLTKSYGGLLAINALNFEIKKGEVVGFLGPNGAGKSTTMKIITGLMAPTSGQALVGGVDVFENPLEVKKKIGYLPETPPVYGDMTVQEYLCYVADLKGVRAGYKRTQVDRAIEKTHLGNVQRRLIQNLSKGFKQRVGIAQALVSDPEILILDEPTVGLDPKQVAEIRDLISQLKGQHTIVLSTHILPEVEATCERIIIINRGEIVAQDTLARLQHLKEGTLQVKLKVKNASEAIEIQLGQLEGVLKIQKGSGLSYLVETINQEEMIEKVASAVLSNKWGLLEISAAKANLEDIFISMTYGSDENSAGGAS